MKERWGARWPGEVPEGWPRIAEVVTEARTAGHYRGKGVAFRNPSTKFEWDRDLVFEALFERGGMPWQAVASRRIVVTNNGAQVIDTTNAVVLPAAIWGRQMLPLRPLWPGFALDTLLYGGLVFLLWSAPGIVRRRIRTRRGHCPTCGYDLRGSPVERGGVCPECGS